MDKQYHCHADNSIFILISGIAVYYIHTQTGTQLIHSFCQPHSNVCVTAGICNIRLSSKKIVQLIYGVAFI